MRYLRQPALPARTLNQGSQTSLLSSSAQLRRWHCVIILPVALRGPKTSSAAKETGPSVLSIQRLVFLRLLLRRGSGSRLWLDHLNQTRCFERYPKILSRHEFEIFTVNDWVVIGDVVGVRVIAMEFVPEHRHRAIYLSYVQRGGIPTKKEDIGSCGVGNFQGDRGSRAKVCPRHLGLFHRQGRLSVNRLNLFSHLTLKSNSRVIS
jgi:hypothetical protein